RDPVTSRYQGERRCNGLERTPVRHARPDLDVRRAPPKHTFGRSSMSATARFRAQLDERIMVLDGAWGTLIQAAGLSPADYRDDSLAGHSKDVTGDPDLLNITRPDVVLDIHRRYLAAGADITTTNTFTATNIGQADYGLQSRVREMNLRGAEL